MKTPDAITKRDILHGAKKGSEKELKDLAKLFLEKEWISDAIDFLMNDPEELKKVRQKAAEEGDAFFVLKTSRFITGEENIPEDVLELCARVAEEKGKTRYAIMAYERLENIEKVNSLRESIKDDGDIIAEDEEDVFIPEHADEIDD